MVAIDGNKNEVNPKPDIITLIVLAILLLQVILLAGLLLRINQVYQAVVSGGITGGLPVTVRVTAIDGLADGGYTIGSATAAVTIVEFSDFTCGYCRVVQETLTRVQEQYGDQIRIVHRHFPRGGQDSIAFEAAVASECAGEQGQFKEMHELLFEKQPRFDRGSLRTYAATLDLDMSQFEQCMLSDLRRERVMHDYADGLLYGVLATPTFFVNGRPLVGAVEFRDFSHLIDVALQER